MGELWGLYHPSFGLQKRFDVGLASQQGLEGFLFENQYLSFAIRAVSCGFGRACPAATARPNDKLAAYFALGQQGLSHNNIDFDGERLQKISLKGFETGLSELIHQKKSRLQIALGKIAPTRKLRAAQRVYHSANSVHILSLWRLVKRANPKKAYTSSQEIEFHFSKFGLNLRPMADSSARIFNFAKPFFSFGDKSQNQDHHKILILFAKTNCMDRKTILMILDGWGIAENPEVSAIDKAHTPFIDSLYQQYANSRLEASGLAVGLPPGQMGNSEVGHMNLGAGRVVYQMLVQINLAVENRELHRNPTLLEAFRYAQTENKKVHFLGLLSDGGVHSHIEHLFGLLEAAQEFGLTQTYVHAFLDGRDTSPNGGKEYMAALVQKCQQTGAQVASVVGRYYAMDRDKRWERVKLAYDLLTKGLGKAHTDPIAAIEESYLQGVTDEFVKPIVLTKDNEPIARIEAGDVVLLFNFRTDRGREITQALSQQAFEEQGMEPLHLYYLTMTLYDETFKNVKILFENQNLSQTIGEVLSQHNKRQLRIAETEKYPHVTFFFSGGEEKVFPGESRIMCPSPKVATYDLQPEMSAHQITEKMCEQIQAQAFDFACLNFANPDMVGHTGSMQAAIKACETVDSCAAQVVAAAQEQGYSVLIIADHGNADCMINPDGSPHTAHTTVQVPCILVDSSYKGKLKNGKLGDVAPTLLELMGIPKPKLMTGESLLLH
jgi:2,3-bisphosphoglycerate-independent phosphoglycerate mutase